MDKILLDVIEEALPVHGSKTLRNEIRLELLSHLESELYDLALRGIRGEAACKIILTSFGKTTMIQEQFAKIHWWPAHERQIKKFLIFLALCSVVQTCFGLLAGTVAPFLLVVPAIVAFVVLSPLTALAAGIVFILYVFLSQVVLRAFREDERQARTFLILGSSAVLLIASLFLSEKPYVATDMAHVSIYATAGFPVSAFNLSSANNPTIDQWLRLCVDWAVWLFVSTIVGLLLPERFLKKLRLPTSAMVAMVLMFGNLLVYIFLRFD